MARNGGSNVILYSSSDTSTTAPNTWFIAEQALNAYLDVAATTSKAIRFIGNRFGTPANLSGSIIASYNLVRI